MKILNTLYRLPDPALKQGVSAPVWFIPRVALRAEGLSILIRLLSPITPHVTQQLWRDIGFGNDILCSPWPQADESALVQNEVELMLQVNGKLRGKFKVAADASRDAIEQAALASPELLKHLDGKAPKKVVVVPGRLVNVVV